MNTRISAVFYFVACLLTLSVTACDSDGDAQRLSNLVSIADAGFTSLVINGDTDTIIETGGTTQLSLEAFSDGAVLGTAISAASADWSSADTLIAEVDSDTGAVTGGSVDGTVAITARFGNLTATTRVRISSAELTSIIIEPADAAFTVNECSDTQFVALGVFQGEAEQRDITDSVVWSVAQTGATFDEIGLLRVTSSDVLTVSATRVADEEKPEVTQSEEVTVQDGLESIEIVADAGTLANGSPLQYRAVPMYANLPDERSEITDNVEWTLPPGASELFAVVDNTLPDKGLVTPSQAGNGVLSAACLGTNISESLNIVAEGSGEFADLVIEAQNSAREFPLQVIWRREEIAEQLVAAALFRDREGFEDVTNDNDTQWSISSSSNNVFSIGNDNDDKGELVINGEGTVTVLVTFTDDDGNFFSATATIVSAAP